MWLSIHSTDALVRGQINEFFGTHLQTDRQQREALSFKRIHRAFSSRGISTRWHGLSFVISFNLTFHLTATLHTRTLSRVSQERDATSPPLKTTMKHGLPCLKRVEPFSEFTDTAASKTMSDWEQGWRVPHAEGAKLPSQDDNRSVDSMLGWTVVPRAEGAELCGFTSELGSQREGAEV
jgi:hypothetical protein